MPAPHPNRSTGRPPTSAQQQLLRVLAAETGTTFTPPRTIAEASAEISRLKQRRRTPQVDRARERRQVQADMASRRGDAAQCQSTEIVGYGSNARWARRGADAEDGQR